jgi:hypothetical protein
MISFIQVVKNRALTEHTLVSFDQLAHSISLDQYDQHTTLVLQQEMAAQRQLLNLQSAFNEVTSHAFDKLKDGMLLASMYSVEPCGHQPDFPFQGTCFRVHRPVSSNEVRENYVCLDRSKVFCTCLVPTSMGYPCQHIIKVNGIRPFRKG